MSRPAYFSDAWFRVSALRFTLRPGLSAARQRFRGRPWYLVHDPVTAKNHRLAPEAWFLLSRLDGHTPLDTVWQQLVAELGDQAPGQTEVIELLGRLHAADLLRSDQPEDLAHLVARRHKQHKPLWRRNLTNPLSVRLPLWDCDALLTRIAPAWRPWLGGRGWLLWLALVLPAVWLALQHANELAGNLSDQLLAPANLLQLALVFPLVKFVHEMAHGVVAKANGVAVHEMGLMFLVLAPVPYVDASAANAIRSKWQRAFVGLAGMWAELALAALALYVWLLVEPGAVRALLHSVMLVAGVSTVVFNANPLLRFDGYYVLCDLLEIPNLAARANEHWLYLIRRHVLGQTEAIAPDATPGERRWFMAYLPTSLVYRLGVTLAIALFIAQQYFFVGVALAILAVLTSVVWPLLKALFYLFTSTHLARHRGRAIGGVLVLLLPLVAALLWVPAPMRVHAEGVLWVPECAEVRAGEGGQVAEVLARNGQRVAAGVPLLRIDNPALQADWAAQAARIAQLDIQWRAERLRDRTQAALTQDSLVQERRNFDELDRRMRALTVSSCLPGELQLTHADDLVGASVARGDLLGFVQSSTTPLVRVVIAQDDIGLVRAVDRPVAVMLADRLGQPQPASLLREVPGGDQRLPAAALSVGGGGLHAVDPGDAEHLKTLKRVFQVDLALAEPAPGARVGTRAFVKFALPPEPLVWQWARRIRQLFLSRLDV